jgi:hypothetical protein
MLASPHKTGKQRLKIREQCSRRTLQLEIIVFACVHFVWLK